MATPKKKVRQTVREDVRLDGVLQVRFNRKHLATLTFIAKVQGLTLGSMVRFLLYEHEKKFMEGGK